MNLASALRSAQNTLTARSAQTAVTSRNIAGADDPTYSRKIAIAATAPNGGAQVVSIRRAADQALFNKMTDTTATAAAQQALVAALETLSQTVGDPEQDGSPAAAMQDLENALQAYAAQPGNVVLAQAVVTKAEFTAGLLRQATDAVQGVRRQADADIALSVNRVNDLLASFETVNTAIVKGTFAGADITDQLDRRDALIAQISEEIGVTVMMRPGNDAVLYTDSGVTLFETHPRPVRFTATDAFTASTSGRALLVDGVPVTGESAAMPIKSGRIQGLVTVRDGVTETYQAQLDEMARGLVEAFAESDQSDPATLPDVPGLFTYSGAPAMPASGVRIVGLAGDIRVNPNADPAQGGNLSRLRDGGISDPGNPAYRYNPGTSASFTDRIREQIDALGADRPFDPAAGVAPAGKIGGFAAASAAWLESARQGATGTADYQTALLQRTSEALSNATGVNLDVEMSILLDLERSYQASTKLIAAVDGMLAALFEAVG